LDDKTVSSIHNIRIVWTRFKDGWMTLDDDERSGRPIINGCSRRSRVRRRAVVQHGRAARVAVTRVVGFTVLLLTVAGKRRRLKSYTRLFIGPLRCSALPLASRTPCTQPTIITGDPSDRTCYKIGQAHALDSVLHETLAVRDDS